MRVLIGSAPSKSFYIKEFSEELKKFGIENKLINISDNFEGFHIKKIGNWTKIKENYKKLIRDYQPDVVLAFRQTNFGLAALEEGIPLFLYLRGDYWKEKKWADKTIYKNLSLQHRIFLGKWRNITKKCFDKSNSMIAVSKYLENEIKKHYPKKTTYVLYQGINTNNWYPEPGITLKHPCVGLVQTANIWGKTKGMLILPKILEAMPDVMFYWAGDGQYRDKILPTLNKYENFKWLGNLEYPGKVRQFFTEIDVYALLSGFDTFGMTIVEAELMKKPVVATKVGGIPETMIEEKTGYLVEEGNYMDWIEKLTELITDETKRKQMGFAGKNFVKENFSWDICIRKFLTLFKQYV